MGLMGYKSTLPAPLQKGKFGRRHSRHRDMKRGGRGKCLMKMVTCTACYFTSSEPSVDVRSCGKPGCMLSLWILSGCGIGSGLWPLEAIDFYHSIGLCYSGPSQLINAGEKVSPLVSPALSWEIPTQCSFSPGDRQPGLLLWVETPVKGLLRVHN